MWSSQQETADMVTFTKEISNGKLHFLYSIMDQSLSKFAKFSEKLIFLTYQSVRNISFSENFANALDEWPLTGIIEELRNVKILNINIP